MSVTTATSLDSALAALAANPSAVVVAGGTDVMVEFNSGHRRATDLLVVNRVADLCTWRQAGDVLEIGAGVTWSQVQEELGSWVPALAEAARTVGSPQIRHAGTIGGNLGTGSPAGDGLPVLAALDAIVHVASAQGRRALAIGDFLTGPKRTALQPGELITHVEVPVLRGYQGYTKVGVRNAMVIATASVALAVDLDGRGSMLRVALGSVGPTVLRCPQAEALGSALLAAGSATAAEVAEFAELVRGAARPIDDHRSTAAYRRHSVGVLAGRLLQRALG
ncbi:MAG TPA: FAD binding domain-containing protein [Ilumatobacteraceae bacterium]|nr:FAD binding domain-containing protein [Ilumatobacteraceae bacterium]